MQLGLNDAGAGDIDVTAQLVERLGSDTNVYTESGKLGSILLREHGNVALNAGDRVGLTLTRNKLHFFDTTRDTIARQS